MDPHRNQHQLVRKGYPFFMLKARGPQRWSILTRLPAFVKPFFLFFCRPFLLPIIAQRGGTDGSVPSLALRASVHTGAAIRTPCGRAWQNATFPGEYKKHCGFPRQSVVAMRTGSKFLHVIARSEATGQSVTPAVGHSKEQYLRRTRKSVTNLP